MPLDQPPDNIENMVIAPPTANERAVIDKCFTYETLVRDIALKHTLSPRIVMAVICQESGGNTYAIRVERGFWSRYGSAALKIFKETPNKFDDKWANYPDLAAMSLGLMQCLYTVAIERGMILQYPTELCNPEIGIEAGCRQLVYCFRIYEQRDSYLFVTPQVTHRALLRYNGGGAPDYPTKVFRWQGLVIAERKRRGWQA